MDCQASGMPEEGAQHRAMRSIVAEMTIACLLQHRKEFGVAMHSDVYRYVHFAEADQKWSNLSDYQSNANRLWLLFKKA